MYCQPSATGKESVNVRSHTRRTTPPCVSAQTKLASALRVRTLSHLSWPLPLRDEVKSADSTNLCDVEWRKVTSPSLCVLIQRI